MAVLLKLQRNVLTEARVKVNGATADTKVLFMSDTKTFFSKNHAWSAGMGDRNGRWAMVIEKDGTVSVADSEPGRGVTVSHLSQRKRLHFDIASTCGIIADAPNRSPAQTLSLANSECGRRKVPM